VVILWITTVLISVPVIAVEYAVADVSLRGGFDVGVFGCRADGFEALANNTRHQLPPFDEKVPVRLIAAHLSARPAKPGRCLLRAELPQDVAEQLKAGAAKSERTLQGEVRLALRHYLEGAV
jgi:hypothetical protein